MVKVQRPQVASLVQEDLRVMAWLAPLFVGRIPVAALANPPALVELFAETIVEELDFRLEAENMLDVSRSMRTLGQTAYVIPRPHPKLVTRRVLVMERLSGFALDEVDAMKAAGVDLLALIRTGIIGFLEGAMFHGVFHGDLHGGNLFIQPDGRTALLDFGITGRLDESKRIAFLKLLAGGSTNDVRVQLPALAELGALPLDTDFEALIAELGLDQPAVDPTQMDPDEMVGELQRVLKALLGYGARMPKELMLFVKNMAFSTSMGQTLAPDLDILDLIQQVIVHFATTHGERIANDLQQPYDPDGYLSEVSMDGYRAALGMPDADAITLGELQARRRIIRERLAKRGRKGGHRLHVNWLGKGPRGKMTVPMTADDLLDAPRRTHLKQLEAESIHIIREVAAEFEKPVMLYSIGKDSVGACCGWPRRRSTPASRRSRSSTSTRRGSSGTMIELPRARCAKELGLELIVHTNQDGVEPGHQPVRPRLQGTTPTS